MAYAIVTLPEGTGIRTVFDDACVEAGLMPDVALVASAPGAVASLASRGMGAAVLSASMATAYPDLVAVPIDDVDIPALLALVWRPQPSPALAALLPHFSEAFEPAPASYPQAGKSA
jgi:DNA-binding transcriptional LysR family regulator